MDRLQPVAHIRQSARHDYAHSVIQVGIPHLIVDINLANGANFHNYTSLTRKNLCKTRLGRAEINYTAGGDLRPFLSVIFDRKQGIDQAKMEVK
jgi:hypothetical protein